MSRFALSEAGLCAENRSVPDLHFGTGLLKLTL